MKLLQSKKGQLGVIEAKFFAMGVVLGIIIAIVLILMANKGILIPFKMGFVC